MKGNPGKGSGGLPAKSAIEVLLSGLDHRPFVCFYAFMRTTVELPSELMRRAKARAAAKGESLKTLLTRAVAAEIGASHHETGTRARVRVPLFGDPKGPRVRISNADIARAIAEDDVASVRRFNKKTRR